MVTIALDEIIAGREAGGHGQQAHHRFVVTVFGLYGRPCGRFLPVSGVVRLLTELGYEGASVRSSISRLKKRGVLVSGKIHGANAYAMAPELEDHMRIGDERILAPRTASVGDPWLLASYSVPESERSNRHKIRAGLARLGFGTVASGLSIAPIRLQAEAEEYMDKHGLSDYIEFFVSSPAGGSDLRDKVARWWDLDELERLYGEFLTTYSPELDRLPGRSAPTPAVLGAAFRTYVPMITQWRRLPYQDPGLPPELLPDNWIGTTARRVFSELNRVLAPLAKRHALQVLTDDPRGKT